MRVSDYTRALTELTHAGNDIAETLSGLMTTLKRKGHEKLYPKILKSFLDELMLQEKRGGVELILAREKDREHLAEHIRKGEALLGSDVQRTRIDDSLIGGYILRSTKAQIDASYKKSLLTIYRSLTNT